jgi:hypothetical protein
VNRALTETEKASFLLRHPTIAARVSEFLSIVNTVGYDQAPKPPGGYIPTYDVMDYWLQQLPGWIPSWGLAVPDDVFQGTVVIFPNAYGDLLFTLTDAPDTVTGEINKPPYQSPEGTNVTPIEQVVYLGVLLAGVYIYNSVKR